MKLLVVALLLLSGTAQASEVNYSRAQDELYIDFISWCEENNVMGQDPQGNNYVKANCSLTNRVCKAASTHRHNRVIHTATCLDQ